MTRLLVLLLRLGGTVTVIAFLAMVMPTDWMVSTHRRLGMGELPRLPVIDYLTRSIAALYGFHGVLLFLISRDPVRYKAIVQFVGVMNLLFGVMLVAIDLHAGMPSWWTFGEGPPIVAFGLVILALARRL